MRQLVVGFSAGICVGAGGCYFYLSATKQLAKQEARGDKASLQHPALKYGMPETDIVRVYEGYVAAFDYRTRNPKWVLEKVSTDGPNDVDRSKSEFFEDPGVDKRLRNTLGAFRNSGYDRGHMAPAANHKGSQKEMDETFSLTNISPQVGKGFNRDYWARFEMFLRQLTRQAKDVYIITGPLWLPTQQQGGPEVAPQWKVQYPCIGEAPQLVSVPTHYYKVVLADGRDSSSMDKAAGAAANRKVAVGAFVMPNSPIDPKTPLSAFVVPLEDLEVVAGTRFFPEFIGTDRRKALDAAAAGWRAQGLSELRPFDRLSLVQAHAALPTPAALLDAPASSQQLLLPAASSASSTAPAATPSAQQAQQPQRLPPPKTVGGGGAVHVCEYHTHACRLPPENFYNKGNSGGDGGPPRSRRS